MSDAVQRANERIEAWRLGTTSMQYETGGRGAGTVSTGVGDPGGVSYGTYQLSSRQPDGRPGTIYEYLGQSRYADRFEGLAPSTPEFGRAWRELAASEPDFAHDQHEFIRRTHYDIQVERLKERGIDLSTRGTRAGRPGRPVEHVGSVPWTHTGHRGAGTGTRPRRSD